MFEPLGCSQTGANEGVPEAQLDTRSSWGQPIVAWTLKMLFYFHHLHLNLCYANEVSSGQVLGVNRLFIKGRERNAGSKPVQRGGARKGEDTRLVSRDGDGRAKGAKVLPPSESETGKQTCWTKIIHVSSLCLQES